MSVLSMQLIGRIPDPSPVRHDQAPAILCRDLRPPSQVSPSWRSTHGAVIERSEGKRQKRWL